MNDWRVAPVLVVQNVSASVAYYRDALGFQVIGTFGHPVEMAFVGRGGVQLMLQDAEGRPTPGPNSNYKSIAWDALFWVPDVSGLHSEVVERGATIRRDPHDTLYGTVEFHATDPDSHVVCFCQVKST
jgi:uncharacterized glyoxalase superfamily protein PhnB